MGRDHCLRQAVHERYGLLHPILAATGTGRTEVGVSIMRRWMCSGLLRIVVRRYPDEDSKHWLCTVLLMLAGGNWAPGGHRLGKPRRARQPDLRRSDNVRRAKADPSLTIS